ncbi:MAG: hypothetical protein HN855_13895 [Anaerolineae bacterium]|jgi:alpha-2-macroglobulin|nr:hypothetical protein [Anaerolineae bacterium]MBT7070621.1 hypothetical protein [Anaerolineae bacterium]MBT7326249.1 hypothetical protein [Anaerolineae bacterium]
MKKRSLMGIAIIFLLIVGVAGCSFGGDSAKPLPTPSGGTDSGEGISLDEDDPEPLTFTLSEGSEQPDEIAPSAYVPGAPLPEEELASLLERLPALVADPADAVDFNLPDEVIPPPRAGETLEESFPPEGDAAAVTAEYGALEVLRYSPEGEIPIAPFVNITFNQPMVPLTTIQDLSELDVPVQISPAILGTWRWLGTKTLNFQADSDLVDRLPMATEYEVFIPAGTESAVGGVLAENVVFTFNTPTPQMKRYHPWGDPQPLEPIFFISFDQRVDPASVLENLTVTADGRNVDVKLASADEVAEDKTVSNLAENAQDGRWLAFRAYEPLPADAEISIVVEAGTPSAEGPLLTPTAQYYSFYTYAPLKLTDHRCGWSEDCRPLMPLTLEFNNPIDAESFDEGMLTISPELLGATVNIYGDTIQISGMTEGQTTYKVKVSGEIKDVFGQMLGRDEQVRFKIGSAEPFLVGPDQRFITLDPAAKDPSISYYVMNYKKLDVQIYAVQPSDWQEFLAYLDEYQWTDEHKDPPGKKLLDETRDVDTKTDILSEINLDLSEFMDGDFGHFVVIVKPHRGIFEKENYYETVHVWAQVTQIGLDVFSDHSEMVVWANALADGAPLTGVKIAADVAGVNAATGEDGIAKFAFPSGGATYITAQVGDDIAMLPRNTYYWDEGGWHKRSLYDDLRWFVYDDRAMYRPGEEVHIKGWIRKAGGGQLGDISLFGDALTGVNYSLIGAQGNELATGRVDVNLLGGFDFMLELPESVNLGYTQLQLYTEGGLGNVIDNSYYHSFQIQEFRRPEFEVSARNETQAPYFVGEHAILAVEAKYFAGGALPNAETNWWVNSNETNYSPPNWDKFTFGFWTPWWYYNDFEGDNAQSESFTGVTDSTGTHYLRLDFGKEGTTRPTSITAEATVMDLNRQAWTSGTSVLVHPADVYVGLRSERYFVERGEPLDIEVIVADLDGNTIADRPITVEAARIVWKSQGGWHEELLEPQSCEITSALEPVSCTFDTAVGGRYRITALVTDEEGRKNESRITRWVSGGERPPSREVEKEEITLIPDKDEYQPGDVAEILVQTPFTPAEVLLTVTRSGILYTERHLIEEGTLTLQIPIKDAHIPNIHIQVDAVGSAARVDDAGAPVEGAPARPAYASGNLTLSIPPLTRTLELDATLADDEIEPGGKTTLSLELKDANGEPVANAELAVVVVDESILALTNYQLSDPVSIFYSQRGSDLSSVYSRTNIILTDPLALAASARGDELQALATVSADMNKMAGVGGVEEEAMMEMAAPMAAEAPAMEIADGEGGGNSGASPIAVRSNFNPLATFEAEVHTDANGKARVSIDVPDNLTRYRVMVVAVDSGGQQFGKTETNLTARLPLMVRPSAPRFLNFGDKFEFPILLQNQTDEPIEVDVAIQATNITLPEGAGQRVTVPANDRVEVRFAAETEMAGIAQFQIGAVSGSYADAATLELPIYTPATTEAFATYGVVDGAEGGVSAIAQPIAKPSDVYAQFGGLEIQTSSTALQTLTDAVMYLSQYSYACTEQLSSRILGIAALRDVLTAFEAEGLPSAAEMEASVNRDVTRLQGIQNWDGGFPYWRRGQESIPFNTIHVAHALQRAKDKGFDVPAEMQESLSYYLVDIESHYPYWYSEYTRRVLSSYALYVRDLMGDNDTAKARALLEEAPLEGFSFEAIGWIWQVLVDDPNSSAQLDEIRLYINNHVVETAGAANFTTSYDDQTYLILSSNRRADAVLLDVMIADNPDADLIPKLVNGLLAHRTRGRWGSTQENVFVLLAMDRYFNTYESQTPDFVARIWLGETYAGEHAYEGYSTERHETNIPMTYLVNGADLQDLVLSKDGTGRLYYRLGLKYAPTDLNLDPLDMGFVVTREYEGVDDPEDVWQDDDGVWHIKAGARVRVKLKMVADNRRYHVALVDPLPAGLEIVNPDLAVSSNAGAPDQNDNPFEMRYGWWWWRTWYEHENLRDERAEAFTSLLWDGVYDYSYIARATTPGTFIAPPAKAEEMYSPEVFGRSGSDWVVVD